MGLDIGTILNVILAVLGGLFLLSTMVFVGSVLWSKSTSGKAAPTLPVISTPPATPAAATTLPMSLTQWLAPLNALPEGQLLGKAVLSEIQQLGVELGKTLLAALAGKMLTPLLPSSTTPAATAAAPAPQMVIDNGQAALQSQLAALQTAMQNQFGAVQADVATLKETLGKLNGSVKVQIDPSQLQARA